MVRRIYFDHSATTPVDPRVLEEMLPYFCEKFGNASSIHAFGREGKVALEEARERVARLINASASEIYFTSGGTESDNLALKGLAFAEENRKHLITSKVEHHAVLNTCHYLEKQGFKVTYLPVDQYGMVDPEEVQKAITDQTFLISIMHVNNEVGTINPIRQIGEIARERGVYFHTDAVQSYGKLPIDVKKMNIDLLSLSGHKIYGPKGVGALFIRKGIRIEKLNHGGHHERNKRAGTENIPGIVGLGKAAEICQQEMEREAEHLTHLRNAFYQKVSQAVPRVYLNGHPVNRLPGNLNLSFEGVEGESLLLSLDLKGIAASSGSACTSGSLEPSHVLSAMGIKPELAQASVRFTLGRSNTMEDVDYTVKVLPEIVERLRNISALV
ncbi:MAG: cysteine desulfurase NifS [candidate division KSB1 bacterium]|nr:cysteine desulfurase NifS [candidate division KSB1 bacterium]